MKRTFLTPLDRLPILCELGIPLFPFASGWGAALLGVQLIMLLKSLGKDTFRHPVGWVLGAVSGWLFIVTAIAAYPLESFLGLANFIPFFLFFLAFSHLLNSLERLERLAWLFVAPSLGVSLLGLGDLWFGWQTPTFIWQLFGWELTSVGNPPGRLASTFMYANICAAYLLMTLLLGLGLWLKDFSWAKLTKSKVFIYLTVTLLVDGVALILTSSRSAWAIALLGILIYALYIGWWWICAFAGGFTAAVLGASFGRSPWREGLQQVVPYYFWGRLSDQMYGDRPVEFLRSTQWKFVLDMIQQRPFTGWGLRSFTPAYEAATNTWLGHPHNLYLMLISEMGIPFAGLFIAMVGWVLAKGVQTWHQLRSNPNRIVLFSYLVTFGGYSLFNLFDVTSLDIRLNTFAWIILAGIWGLGQQVNQAGDQGQSHGSPEED